MAYAKSKDTRAKLVKSTARLLREKGYAATGLKDILDESGVPRGSLYHHYPGGKEELGAASVEYSGAGIRRSLERLADEAGDPVSAMRQFCDYYIEELRRSEFRRGCPLATVTLEAAANVDAIHTSCGLAFDSIIEFFASRLVDMGVAAEQAEESAIYTISAIEGALMLAKAQRNVRVIEITRDQLTASLEALLETS